MSLIFSYNNDAILPFFYVTYTVFITIRIAIFVNLFFLFLIWLFGNNLYFSATFTIRLYIIFSITLFIMFINIISLYPSANNFSFFVFLSFGNTVIITRRNRFGIYPNIKNCIIIMVRILNNGIP